MLATGESYYLSCNIGTKLLLACGTLNFNIIALLIILISNKLKRNDVCSLMKELVK